MAKRRVYLDNASTTPLDKKVLSAMTPYLGQEYGNPSNLYELGRAAKEAVSQSLAKISTALNCRQDEFIFTGSATESDNLALLGIARANKDLGNRIIVSAIEHKGIMAVCQVLQKEGFEIVYIPVDKNGLLDISALKAALNDQTILVSITMADSETGTLQPIREISEILRSTRRGLDAAVEARPRQLTGPALPYFHTDASQAAAYLDLDVEKLGVDLLTLSAHKLGGPKGIGGLYVRKGVQISPIIFGGGQQGKLRSGTENVPGIVGFSKALELSRKDRIKESAEVMVLRDRLEKGIFTSISKVRLNGHPRKRLPNFLNVSILDVEGEALLLHLDELGIMVNTGSACNSESLEPSYVLCALGNPYEFVHGSLRFSLGRATSKADVDYVIKHLPLIVNQLRRISPLNLNLAQTKAVSDPRAFIGGKTPRFARGEASIRTKRGLDKTRDA